MFDGVSNREGDHYSICPTLSNKDLQRNRGSRYVDTWEYIAVLSNKRVAADSLKMLVC